MLKVSSEQLAVGLLAVAAGVLACMAPAQSDTWWLLRAGQDIVSTLHVPLVDSYSHTAAGLYWPNHEWGTEVLFYLVHAATGMPGLALLCAAAIVSALVISWRLGEGAFEVRFVAFAVALAASTSVFALRPQVFTLAAFSVTCLLFRQNRLWLVPPLIAVWVNLHGAAVLGVVMVAACAAADVATGLMETSSGRSPWRRGSRVWTSLAVLTVSAGATLLSPLGIRLWTFIPESTARSAINQLIEWRGPDADAQHWPFWIAAAALVGLTVIGWRRVDPERRRLVAVAVVMLPLAVQSVRNIPLFLLAAVPSITILVAARGALPATGAARSGARSHGEHVRVNGAILAGVAALAAAFVVLVWWRPPPMLRWDPVSPDAARAIARCGAPLYNTYGTGGEIIWFVPEQKVFVDNRQDPYPPEVLAAARKVEHDGDFRALFDRYRIRCAALPPDTLVAGTLRAADGWAVRFEDRQWIVLTR